MDSPTPQIHLPHWLQGIVASTGGVGLFLIALLDSSVLTFPVINDLLLIDLSIHFPKRMPYYAGMATLGSVGGCLLLYYIARKGGEAMFRKSAGPRAERIQAWTKRNGFVSILVTALLPPPTPFKFFVIGAGALEMPRANFRARPDSGTRPAVFGGRISGCQIWRAGNSVPADTQAAGCRNCPRCR